MKKMISSMKTLVALLMVGATVTSCSSDDTIADQPVQQPVGPQVYTMTVEATKGGDGTRALNLDGNKLNATWTAGDEVEVWTEDGTTTKYGTLIAQSDGASTKLTGTLTTKPSGGETLTLKYLSPNYSSQDGTLTGTANSIDKVCDYATATVTATVDGDNVTTTAAAFENQQAVVKFTLKNKANDSDLSATKLVVNVGGTEYEVNPVSATSEIYVAIPGFNGQTITLTATVGSDTYTYEKSGVAFTNGSFYRVAVKMTKQASAPEGAISGKFTINASGDKVYFSKGNLQATWDGTSWNWHFAENQWDYIGNAAGNTTIDGDGTVSASNVTVDLFGWVGASNTTWTGDLGTTGNAAMHGISNSFEGYGDNASEALKSDWGNTISDGYTWFTLSSAEWTYLFNTRTVNGGQGSGKSYTLGQSVNDKLGVVIYPDDYTGSVYAGSDWPTFEAAGCVFLPVAGFRVGTQANVYDAGTNGFYWSSSLYDADKPYYVFFSSVFLNPAAGGDDYGARFYGRSVRLVRPVE